MPSILKLDDGPRLSLLLPILPLALLVAGCATHPRPTAAAEKAAVMATADLRTRTADTPVSVLRYGRYTLVELAPAPDQQDLMQQVVDITMPATSSATVGDAVRYLLMRTGYLLCDTQSGNASLDAWPLPAAHIHLGPLTLRDALRVLSGPAWDLQIDEGARRVCFTRTGASDPALAPTQEEPRQ